MILCCFQCVKGNKFESDSQQRFCVMSIALSCFQCVKGNKFESDSQLIMYKVYRIDSCFQCVKGNKFESDSQPSHWSNRRFKVVSNVSKVINLKAIHNLLIIQKNHLQVVSNVSKIGNLTIFFCIKNSMVCRLSCKQARTNTPYIQHCRG